TDMVQPRLVSPTLTASEVNLNPTIPNARLTAVFRTGFESFEGNRFFEAGFELNCDRERRFCRNLLGREDHQMHPPRLERNALAGRQFHSLEPLHPDIASFCHGSVNLDCVRLG